MAWINDNANASVLTNDLSYEGNLEIWNDENISFNAKDGTWNDPRGAWVNDANKSSVLTNDAANN